MGGCMSEATPPGQKFQGKWVSAGGDSKFEVNSSGSVEYKTPGMKLDGIGFSGWEDGHIKGHCLCISKEFDIEAVDQNEIKLNGESFKRKQ